MLDDLTLAGVPAHPLVVHAVVVGVPVMALVAVVMLARSPWRGAWAWPVVVVDGFLAVTAWVASETGEGLQAALGGSGVAAEHARYGAQAPLVVAGMAAGALAFALLRRRGRAGLTVGSVLLVASSVLAVVWVVLTGHSGAASHWGWVEL